MLKILVDATPVRKNPSGIGIYVINLIKNLARCQEKDDFELGILYQPSLRKWLVGNFSITEELNKINLPTHCLPLPVTLSNSLAQCTPWLLPYFDRYLGTPDIIHGTDHFVYPESKSLKVITIHDLAFIKYANYSSYIVQKTYLKRIKQCLKWTDLVITFSQSSKNDIIKYLDVEAERIHITSQASRYCADCWEAMFNRALFKSIEYDFSRPYLLLVSTLEPRKNIINAIKAFNYLKNTEKIEHQLVIIGQKGWQYKPILAAIANSPWQKDIHYLGYLSDREVAYFYSQAEVFVYPSYYEGFGLPVLEAMSLGAPVVTSNTSSLPEVAGDAALLIDPRDPIQLAEAILKVISDSQLRHLMVKKGKERAKLFSWEKTARETINAYKSLFYGVY